MLTNELSREQARERLMEEMYVESGVSVEEIMRAFKEYGLKIEVTESDRRMLAAKKYL